MHHTPHLDHAECALCAPPQPDALIAQTSDWRIVWADEAGYPCFVRVVWQAHEREMTDLSPSQRQRLMEVVFAVETAMHRVLAPSKVNLASFGNRTPHVHWHVIPRWEDDAHWPEPNWAALQRAGVAHGAAQRAALAAHIAAAVQALV